MAQECGLLFLGTMVEAMLQGGSVTKCLDLSTVPRWDIRTRDPTHEGGQNLELLCLGSFKPSAHSIYI